MNNYQLYRSNVKLGGQIKWDLSIDSVGNQLVISDFHLSPISDRVPFNRYESDNLLNYTHLENLKKYYSKIEGSFYQPFNDPRLSSLEPVIIPDNLPLSKKFDPHDDTFEMGMSRASQQLYKKPVQFFCPVWLEDIMDGDRIRPIGFEFCVRGKNNDGWMDIVSKTLLLEPNENGEYHNKFINYFYEYLKSIQLDDKLIKTSFEDRTAYITGVDQKTGLTSTKDISSLMNNLLCQERLLMDADSLIIQSFEDHHLAAKQLFNFNFLFDFREFLPASVANSVLGYQVCIKVRVKIPHWGKVKVSQEEDKWEEKWLWDESYLDIKDFYTNYDFVHSKYVGDAESRKNYEQFSGHANIFDELEDYNNVDLIAKNKICPSIIHWSLAELNDYIFNVYPEFGGHIINNGNIVPIAHRYQDSPDIWTSSADEGGINWGEVIKCNQIELIELGEILKKYPYSNFGSSWVNGLHYSNPTKITKANLVIATQGIPTSITNNFDKISYGKKTLYVSKQEASYSTNVLMVQINDIDLLSFRSFVDCINNTTNLPEWLSNLKPWFNSVVNPTIITFDKKLMFDRADGPNTSTIELNHYLESNHKDVIFRYDGYIKPTFVDPDLNNIYYKILINKSDLPKTIFAQNNQKYPKLYPSIGFYPFGIRRLQLMNNDLYLVNENDQLQEFFVDKYEYKWFNLSQVIYLKKDITVKLHSRIENGKYVQLPILIKEYLAEIYPIDDRTAARNVSYYEDRLDYIYNLYKWESDWEYESTDNIKNYIYTVKLTLK